MKKLFIFGIIFLLMVGFANNGFSAYPEKEVEWILWSSPGGGSDTTARTVGIPLRRLLKQPLIIRNMTGGSGARAMTYLQNQKADGYTLLFVTNTLITTLERGTVPYKLEDFIPVFLLNHDAHLVAVSAKSKTKTLEDLVALGKERPIKWGMTHYGGTDHVASHVFAKSFGIKYRPVVYQGGGEVKVAALSGVLDAFITNTTQIMGQVEAGNIKILAVMAEKRLATLPDVPTLKEKGYNIILGTWRGVCVKKGTDPEVVKTLEKYFSKATEHKVYQDFLKNNAMDYNVKKSEAFKSFILKEYDLYSKAIKEIGVSKKK
ncbi:MAG: tripartite tricarboxylate transporter substrate binding protein [Deltaproteobacteria bacterium]|nr:tripartite tricarboxylate transporter substrate binding protein [Deltaproteobacteria bacterium]MBW2154501.1 tripartite tricarboxylate transporter substrate binding protein [Deltaproteobacteria bacterium]